MADNQVIFNADVVFDQTKIQQRFAQLEQKLKFQSPFGAMSKDVTNFNYQLDRATQRVVTLGTAFTVLATANRLIRSIVDSTVAVEKSLNSVNTIFKLTNESLSRFSNGLFDISRETATSFDKVAEAAQEFARQGLSVAETQKAVRAALMLSRDANIDVTESVKALTAATNSFSKEGLSRLQIANRLASVDAAFAVSSKDLAEALVRTGSAAADAGVSFNQFIGLVTAAQQISQRGGSVIASALNTIFTRVNRKDTLDALDSLGIAITDVRGQALPTIQVLQNFATAYDKMTGSIKAQSAELVGGVRQLNVLKATLKDLGSQNSVFSQVQDVISRNSNEIERRNAARNQTLAALGSQAVTTGQQIGSNIGNVGFAGPAKNLISGALNNPVVEAFTQANGQAETAGGQAAETFLKGFGSALIFGVGPILLNVLTKVSLQVGSNLLKDVAAINGLNDAEKTRLGIEAQIVELYKAGGSALQAQLQSMTGLAERAALVKSLLGANAGGSYVSASSIAAEIESTGGLPRRPRVPGFAGGYIPFAQESAAIGAGVGGATPGARPVLLNGFNFGGGKVGSIVANTSEYLVPHMAGGSAIYNQDMAKKMGLPPGARPIAAGGYIPNAAEGSLRSAAEIALGGGINSPTTSYQAAIRRLQASEQELDAVWTGVVNKFASKLKDSAATLNINQQISGLGGVLTQGPVANAAQLASLQSKQTIAEAVRVGLSNRAGGPDSIIDSRPWSGGRYQLPPLTTATMQSLRTSGLAPDTIPLSAYPSVLSNAQYQASQGSLGRQVILNSALQQRAGGTGINQLGAAERNALINQIRSQVIQDLGFGGNVPGALANPASRFQIQQQVAQRVASQNVYGSTIGASSAAALASPSLFSRINQRANTVPGTLGLSLGLPFFGGMIGEGQGGTTGGQAQTAASYGLQGAGTGAGIGSLVPGIGTLGGAGIGAVLGALTGWITKASKSFEELSMELDQKTKKMSEELTNVNEVFRIEGDLKNAISANNQEQVIDLKKQLAINRTKVSDPRYRALIDQYSGNPEQGAVEAARTGNNIIGPQIVQSNLIQALSKNTPGGVANFFGSKNFLGAIPGVSANTFTSDPTKQDKESAVNAVMAAIATLPVDQLQGLRNKTKTNLPSALEFVARLGGVDANKIPGMKADATNNPDLARYAIFTALNNRGLQEAAPTGAIEDSVNRERDLTQVAAGYRRNAVFGTITGGANRQINQVRQQIALSNPELTDAGRLSLQRNFNVQDLEAQNAVQRSADLLSGKSSLLTAAGKTGTNQDALDTIKGFSSLSDLKRFRDQFVIGSGPNNAASQADVLKSQANFPNLTDPKYGFMKDLEDLINQMEELDKTQTENTRVIDKTYDLNTKKLQFDQSYLGAISSDIGRKNAASQNARIAIAQNAGSSVIDPLLNTQDETDYAAEVRKNTPGYDEAGLNTLRLRNRTTESISSGRSQRQAVQDLFAIHPNLVTGSQISESQFGNAQDLGRQGDSLGSLSGGFDSVFTGLKRDLSDFSSIGKQVADTLNSSLGNAFGDFITGSKTAGAAFRGFATSVLGDASKLLASKAVSGLLGSFLGTGPSGSTGGEFTGSSFHFAAGGTVPSMLMGGEYVVGPNAARRIGYDTLRRMNSMAQGGAAVLGGSGVKDDVPANLAPGSFVIKKSAAQKLGMGYMNALVSGQVQHRAIGGDIFSSLGPWGILAGAVLGGGLGYLAGGKKGAIGGALLGGIGGYLAGQPGNYSGVEGGSAQGAVLSVGQKVGLGLGAAAGLGLIASGLNPDKPGPLNDSQLNAYRQNTEADQANAFNNRPSPYPILQIGPQGQSYLTGYTDGPATRRWADGGSVDVPLTVNSAQAKSSGGASAVSVKIDIHNNTATSSSSVDGGDGQGGAFQGDFANKLQKSVQAIVQQELVNQSRPDGFFSQSSRFIQR